MEYSLSSTVMILYSDVPIEDMVDVVKEQFYEVSECIPE
jgi:hypothetical protein